MADGLVAAYKLVRERHLVELHLVDCGSGRAQQRRGCNDRRSLHDDGVEM